MRFLLIQSADATLHEGSSLFGWTSRSSANGSIGSSQGYIGSVVMGECPPNMIATGDGTLLIATGIGPMVRMRQNENRLTLAGVPAPLTSPVITEGSLTTPTGSKYWRYSWNGINGSPAYTKAWYTSEARTYDYSSLAQIVGYMTVRFVNPLTGVPVLGPLVKTPEGQVAADRRMADFLGAPRLHFATSNTDDGWSFLYQQAWGYPTFFSHFNTYEPVTLPSYQVGQQVPVRFKYQQVSGIFYSHLRDEASNSTSLITGRYQCWMRYVDKDGLVSNPSPVSADYQISQQTSIVYTELEEVHDSRVVKRQIFRNTNGQSDIFYLDVETDDLTLTEIESTKTDEQLKLSLPQAMFDNDGFSLAFLYSEPPTDKPYIIDFNGITWACGSVNITTGMLEVANGSDSVIGVGTTFNKYQVGWELAVGGSTYTVYAVDEDTQELTLDRNYEGEDDNFATYSLHPFRAERNRIQFTLRGYPESWPVENFFILPNDDDDITGMTKFNDSLYVLKNRHIYRIGQGADPIRDAEIKPAAERGCISHRCAVPVGPICYLLDRQGIYAFANGAAPEPACIQIADVFRRESDWLKVNWEKDPCRWHAVHMEELSLIRWYVSMAGEDYPRHAIAFDYRRNRWWIETYPIGITSSCVSNAILGYPLLGAEQGMILTSDVGPLDLITPTANTRLGVSDVLSEYTIELDDTPPAAAVGTVIAIVDGRGRGQKRIIASISGNEITVSDPWIIYPADADQSDASTVQIGAVDYSFTTAEYDYIKLELENPQGVIVKFDRSPTPLTASLTVIEDQESVVTAVADAQWGALSTSKSDPGVFRIDLSSRHRYAKANLDGARDQDDPSLSSTQAQIDGFSGLNKPVYTELYLAGPGDSNARP